MATSLAAVLLGDRSLAGPSPTPDPAYASYAEYYLRHYAPARRTSEPSATDPYRYVNLYSYYRAQYHAGPADATAEAAASARYRRMLGAGSSTYEHALRYWSTPATASVKRGRHGR